MAQINDIVAELNSIADAFTSVNSFYFDEVSYINDDRKKVYPAILVDSRNIDINPVNFTRSNLPSRVVYGFKLFFFDDYHTSEQKTVTRRDKYSELETIANQFLAEVKSRTEAYSNLEFSLKTRQVNNGFVVDDVHNDKLVQMVYDVSFEAWGECLQGTFVGQTAPPSEDVTVNVNSNLFSVEAPFSTLNIPVQYENGNLVGTITAGVVEIPDITACDSDLFTTFYLEATDDVSSTITIDSASAGTYTSISDDGGSGTITIDINGGGFGAFSNPQVLIATDTIQIKKTTTTSDGWIKLTGTY